MTYADVFLNQAGSTFLTVHWMQTLSIKTRYHLNQKSLLPLMVDFKLESDFSMAFPETSEWIVIGSGSDSSAYEELITTAKVKKIKTSLVFDSWVNFEKRFQTPPDEIIVFDMWAFELAKRLFPKMSCIRVVNYYLEHLQASFRRAAPTQVLILDSINNSYNGHYLGPHGDNCICEFASRVNRQLDTDTVIRKHPSREGVDCELFLSKLSSDQDSHRITFSEASLITDLEHSIFLLGPASYAHYLAESLNVPAFFSKKPNSNWNGPKFRELQL
jgi:hypothetical protein